LIAAGVIEWQPVDCEHCNEKITEPRIYCESCKSDISDQITFHIDGCIKDDEQEDFKAYPEMKAQAKQFANKLKHQGYMYYLLIDLTESENLQRQNSFYYNEFFRKTRAVMKREGLSQALKGSLSFGEVGDCLKLAFLSADDFISALGKFSAAVEKEKLGDQFPMLKGKETIFPRFDGTIGKIAMPEHYDELEKIFCITLNGAIDFNDYELTKLFRLDHQIKTKKTFYDGRTIMSLWVQKEIFSDLKWDAIPTVDVVDTTHDLIKKEKFGLLGFTDTGDYFHESKPSEYKV